MKHANILALASGASLLLAANHGHAASEATALQNHSIGYVMTGENRAIYETPGGKTECPQGYNDGPREQFKVLYPKEDTWTMVGTRLAREAETWLPSAKPEALPYHEI